MFNIILFYNKFFKNPVNISVTILERLHLIRHLAFIFQNILLPPFIRGILSIEVLVYRQIIRKKLRLEFLQWIKK
jgi:hypothetical protein